MGKIIEYKLVTASNTANFDDTINDELKNGYELYGNPYYNLTYHCQAMVKREKKVKAKRKLTTAPMSNMG